MMHTREAACMKCGITFTVHQETGRKAHLLHCVRCGRDKRIGAEDIKEVYNRSLASLLVPPTPGIKCPAEPVRPLFSHEPIDCRKYKHLVEHLAGSCICGAVFRFSGKPRCPGCRSVVIRIVQAKKLFAVQAAQAVPA